MLSSLLHSVCPYNSSLKTSRYSSSLFPQIPQQQHSPPPSLRAVNMSSPSSNSASPKSPASTMSSITPPGSPPSPTMSMESIRGHPFQLDMVLQQQTKQKIRVMIVDDNSINLSILSQMLKVYFAQTVQLVAVMTSGVAALEKLNEEEIDLILMDIDMPVLTGVETTAAIRRNTSEYPILKQNQRVPIIAVTTSDGADQRELYLQAGMLDCVSKPIAITSLRQAIESVMNSTGHSTAG